MHKIYKRVHYNFKNIVKLTFKKDNYDHKQHSKKYDEKREVNLNLQKTTQ